ncbi:cysteine hydrolase family protein [Desulfovibrio sp. TomC]|uniref:cysteine hydrolase family protein n=1 Tax=Desulfovibrio sp. TomC TaxID=1562888 RepID=UPI0005747B48|nr:isochorismatase family cysteine hydrolase [Desulfovibrio sp. TomC]KHK01421.1 Nicotinamidase [Desulfovibrio sp. TomC]
MGKLFVIVDMLNDFIKPSGKLYFAKGQGVVDPIVRLRAAFRAAGWPVLYVNDAHPEDSEEFASWPPHCVMGTWGARIVDELQAGPGDIVFHKDAMSFLAHAPAENLLKAFGATHLYMAGVATEYCVQACSLDARARGLAVTVVLDAIAGVDLHEGDADKALETMRQAGVAFTDTAALLGQLG